MLIIFRKLLHWMSFVIFLHADWFSFHHEDGEPNAIVLLRFSITTILLAIRLFFRTLWVWWLQWRGRHLRDIRKSKTSGMHSNWLISWRVYTCFTISDSVLISLQKEEVPHTFSNRPTMLNLILKYSAVLTLNITSQVNNLSLISNASKL